MTKTSVILRTLPLLAITLAGTSLSHAAPVTLTASDAFGTTSFNTAGNWNNAAAPTAGNDYFNGGFLLRTPTDGASYTFAGDSLNISGIAGDPTAATRALMYKGTGTAATITVNNLTIQDGGYLRQAQSEADTFRLAGNLLTIGTGGANISTQGPLIIESPLAGTGTITIADSGSTNVARVVTFASGASTFAGNVVVSTANQSRMALADTSIFNFTIGASGVNNSITGAGVLNLNGAFSLNLSGASTNPGDMWNLVANSTLAETYGPTFSVTGFTENSDVWTMGNYVFSEATGNLSYVPEPGTGLMLLSGMGILLGFRRSRRSAV